MNKNKQGKNTEQTIYHSVVSVYVKYTTFLYLTSVFLHFILGVVSNSSMCSFMSSAKYVVSCFARMRSRGRSFSHHLSTGIRCLTAYPATKI